MLAAICHLIITDTLTMRAAQGSDAHHQAPAGYLTKLVDLFWPEGCSAPLPTTVGTKLVAGQIRS